MGNLSLSEWAFSLSGYVPRDGFANVGNGAPPNANDVTAFVRLWLLEGIPFCFVDHPVVYEKIRESVAGSLLIEANDVSMVGSAKLGFSLSPRKFLREFSPGISDLDLFCVAPKAYANLLKEYDDGVALWQGGAIAPSPGKEKYLRDNLDAVRTSRRRGYIDTNKVPVFRPTYVPKLTLKCEVILKRIHSALAQAEYVPSFGVQPSLRVYETWDAAVRQNVRSLQAALSDSRSA